MARRGKSSAFENLMDLVARLPWWAGVALALASHVLLRSAANRALPAARTLQDISAGLPAMMWQGFAVGGQYVVPLICLLGALASFLRRRKRQALFMAASQASGPDGLNEMSWQEFEMLVAEGFRRRGYRVRESGGGGADGGVDVWLAKDGKTFLVQCKQWKAVKVGVSTVRELYGAMAAARAHGGFVVTSGRFTQDAQDFATRQGIDLLEGTALLQLLRDGRAHASAGPRAAAPDAVAPPVAPAPPPGAPEGSRTQPPTPALAATPACPRCAQPMVRRKASRGAAAGREFWGCTAYAAGCRGTRNL